jgi:hypothetical protein
MANPRGPYLGGPTSRRRQQLRLNAPPPGGFAPTPHHLRQSSDLRKQEQRQAQRQTRDTLAFERVAVVILALLVVAVVVIVLVAVT